MSHLIGVITKDNGKHLIDLLHNPLKQAHSKDCLSKEDLDFYDSQQEFSPSLSLTCGITEWTQVVKSVQSDIITLHLVGVITKDCLSKEDLDFYDSQQKLRHNILCKCTN